MRNTERREIPFDLQQTVAAVMPAQLLRSVLDPRVQDPQQSHLDAQRGLTVHLSSRSLPRNRLDLLRISGQQKIPEGTMADTAETAALEHPRVYLVHMLVFTLVVCILTAILFPNIRNAFYANVGLNGLIIGTLLLGTLYAYRMVWRLFPEINWVNGFRIGQSNDDNQAMPVLLAPMATLLGDRQGRTVLSTNTMRSLLDSLASRLDESRDLLRYLVGLLIFLGLLGTFWGLLQTVTSVGDAIKNLDVTAGQSSSMFEELKSGLQKPLAGMGLSFSSSLFGLAGSLILGFLDLKASQAQNRFYHNLEDWLSTITDIQVGEGGGQTNAANYLRFDLQGLQRGIDKLGQQLENGKTAALPGGNPNESIEQLADAVASLVQQMREEQKMVRSWAQTQQVQQNEIQRLLIRATGPADKRTR
jgi:HAMP domain-containing protein